jgi:AraC-like DNA-binding protein
LIYVIIYHSTAAYIHRLPDVPVVPAVPNGSPKMSQIQMKEICDTITRYLETSHAYKNSDFCLTALSVETKIHSKNISAAINGYLHKNFFELVNEMRIEEAKRLLLNLSDDYNIDSIFAECGFRSRTTFFVIFKKNEGQTPAQWLKSLH